MSMIATKMAEIKYHDSIRTHWKALLACSIISICEFQVGIDATMIGGIQAMPGFLTVFGHEDPKSPIGYNISTVRQQLISSLMILGQFGGAASAGIIAKFIGREPSLWIACGLSYIANIVMMTTTSIGVLYFARLLIGVSNGLFSTFAQLYIQECAPNKYRGMMIGAATYWITFAPQSTHSNPTAEALIDNIIDNFTTRLGLTRKSYIIPLSIGLVIPSIIFLSLLFLPESPRWLLSTGQTEAAEKSLRRLHHSRNVEVVDEELRVLKLGIDEEMRSKEGTEFGMMWRSKTDRRRALLAVGAIILQQASGAGYIIIYSTYFFEMANIGSPFENTCIMAGIGSFVLIVNSFVITRWGYRRVFLGCGLAICGVSQLIMAVVYTMQPGTERTGKIIVAFTIISLTSYNGMISTYSQLCGAEFPSQRFRSYTFGIATAMGSLCGWLTAFTAPYFINPGALGWGPKYGYIWAGSCLIALIWVWLFLPEVKGRTFEEIDEMFEAKLNAREFERYQCHGQAALLSIGLGLTDRNEVERLSSVEDVFGEKSGVSVAEGHSLGAKI